MVSKKYYEILTGVFGCVLLQYQQLVYLGGLVFYWAIPPSEVLGEIIEALNYGGSKPSLSHKSL